MVISSPGMRDGTVRSRVGSLNRPYWQSGKKRLSRRFPVVFCCKVGGTPTPKRPSKVDVVVVWFQSYRVDPYNPTKITKNRARLGTDLTGQFSSRTSPRWLSMKFCCKVEDKCKLPWRKKPKGEGSLGKNGAARADPWAPQTLREVWDDVRVSIDRVFEARC
ncbi:hypothetical protein CRG98_024640 [Punica granatum]|uniref:Uncharacterized protein n=1 Tax=Punica granatum TaxID=22663 RepID=A0A2I0JFF8_PUNGR|nr:hypothetical protein CRG98_024640 [Punica granatum]